MFVRGRRAPSLHRKFGVIFRFLSHLSVLASADSRVCVSVSYFKLAPAALTSWRSKRASVAACTVRDDA